MRAAPACSVDAPIAVIGIGNVLLGDDGFGPTVVELLRAGWEFPDSVFLLDAGTPSLDLAAWLDGRDTVIVVDTVAAVAPPGTVRVYSGSDITRLPRAPRVSPHDPGLQDALAVAELGGHGPRVVILIGAVPVCTEMGIGLSAPVQQATAAAIERVLAATACSGAPAVRRTQPLPLQAWWMAGGAERRATAAGRASDSSCTKVARMPAASAGAGDV